jgi:hypothetical protein
MITKMDEKRQSSLVAGSILILLGVGFFALRFMEGYGEAMIFFLIGGAFMAGYLFRRSYGLLIPGGILLGLGLGSIGESVFQSFGDISQIGLGVGFVSIYVIHLIYVGKSHWWPLIPGGILIVTGLASASKDFERILSVGWPLMLIFAGLIILAGAFGLTGRKKKEDA